MSGSSYYSVRDIQLRQLEQTHGELNEVDALTRSIALVREQLRAAVSTAQNPTITAVSEVAVEKATLAVLEAVDVERLAVRAQADAPAAPTASGSIDLSALIPPVHASTSEYVEAAKARIVALFPLTVADDSQVAAALAAADRVSSVSLAQAKETLDPILAQITEYLREDETAEIEDAYFEYLAVCALAEVLPQRLPLMQMRSATAELTEELRKAARSKALHDALVESLPEVGLSVAGQTVFAGQSGSLLVGEDDNCALFLTENRDSLLFTTVLSQRTQELSAEKRGEVGRSIANFCDKKRKLVDESLARRGVILDTGFDHGAEAAEHSEEFAAAVAMRKQASQAASSAKSHSKRAED